MAGWVKRVVGQGQKEESNRHIMHTGNLLQDSVQLSQHDLQTEEGKDEDGDGETDLFLIQHL